MTNKLEFKNTGNLEFTFDFDEEDELATTLAGWTVRMCFSDLKGAEVASYEVGVDPEFTIVGDPANKEVQILVNDIRSWPLGTILADILFQPPAPDDSNHYATDQFRIKITKGITPWG